MAVSPAPAFQATQTSLASLLRAELARIWPLLNPARKDDTFGLWAEATAGIIDRHARTAALMGADWYDELRDAAGAPSPFTVSLLEPPGDEEIFRSLGWATRKIDADPAGAVALVDGVTQKLAIDPGRDTITNAAREDDFAVGQYRYARPGCCYFCAMLATRGASYHANTEQAEGSPYHDHCNCVDVPIFKGQTYKPDEHIREFSRLYADSTGAYSGQGKINAFRRAFDSR